jgi:Fic family protein
MEKRYELEAPPAASASDILTVNGDPAVTKAVSRAQERYLPWPEFKRKTWVPGKKEAVWHLVKLVRKIESKDTPIVDERSKPYTFSPRLHAEFLHEVDLELGGIFLGLQDFSEGDKRRIIRRNLIEESIASSQLEGANTSRSVAKKMLAEGREPRDKSERMIVNNHETMRWIEEELKNQKLSVDLLFELHRRVTQGTIDLEHQGTIRQTLDDTGQPLVVKPWDDTTIAYVAPKREFVEEHLPRLMQFANDELEGPFVHPLMKAIMLHFWIGLLHPFEDGNGRLARILFYWYMLRRGYWAFSYLSISERILKSSKQYAMAYIYAEQDDFDLNYFIQYNVERIKLARAGFREYLAKKIVEARQASNALRKDYSLNERQINLLQYLAKDEQRYTTLKEHNNVNSNIGKVTASTDLQRLVEKGFLTKEKRGRNVFYYPTSKIRELFA